MVGDLCRLFAAAAVVVAVVAVSPQASATTEYISGEALYAKCTSKAFGAQAAADGAYCNGFVGAVADIMFNEIVVLGQKACISQGVMPQQLVEIVRQFLTARPELRQYDAASLVAHALSDAFPCSQ